jgi:hypothetical protein
VLPEDDIGMTVYSVWAQAELGPFEGSRPEYWSSYAPWISDGTTLTYSASVKGLERIPAATLRAATIISFEPGSELRSLPAAALGFCRSLKSICFPASLESLPKSCFTCYHFGCHSSPVESVSFAPGSRLETIEAFAFEGCDELKSIRLPASVSHMTGASFARCTVAEIAIDADNPCFHVRGHCVVDSTDSRLIYHFGAECEIKSESIPPVSSFDSTAFQECAHLESIVIPSSVTLIGSMCFRSCRRLRTVSLCADSRLAGIEAAAFGWCQLLESISLPASVEVIGRLCFELCGSFARVTLPVDSKLVRIDAGAFTNCSSLQSFFVPSSVESIGESCFYQSTSMLTLTFGSGSHLRELLDLPPCLSVFSDIPDSVEMIGCSGSPQFGVNGYRLNFGRESKLTGIAGRFMDPDRGFMLGWRVANSSAVNFEDFFIFQFAKPV